MSLMPNIILIGFMGSGKTVTANEISKILGLHFWDMDGWIENETGEKVKDIFKKKGEEFFREEERKAVLWLKDKENFVVSTGGGAWLHEENRKKLLKSGWCIWLKVSKEDVWKRIGKHLGQRPLLAGSANPKETIQMLLKERNPQYSLAHASFDTSGKTPKQVAFEIVEAFNEARPFDLQLPLKWEKGK